ncbi:hypothetical protein Q7P37_004794 [Cladosporium fusiforme]
MSQINGGFPSSHKLNSSTRGQSNKISLVHDSAQSIKRKSALELGSGVVQSIGDTSFIKLVQWIRAERLSTLPHQGSTWDTVLIRALYVSERLHKFETAIQGFALGTNAAAELAYSHIRLLLELGHENSDALDKAFGLFYKSALTISSLLDRSELLSCTHEVQEQLCHMYTDLVTLVVEVAVYFYKTVQSMTDGEVSLDLYEVFGETLEATTSRRSHISNLIWSYQIDSEADTSDALSIDVLSKWLSPQDRVLEMLGSDHTTFTDQLAERTGLWFQENLTNFVKGSNECLLLTGPAGAGKTTLSAAIAERLQRPVARQSLQTIFVSIGAVKSEATTLHVVKSILHQLLSNRVGNLGLYHALVNAYHESRSTADPQAYENHLWNALSEALQRPLEGANSTVIIVDGLDEVVGGQTAGQQLLEKLTKAVGRGKRTKLVGLSESLSLPSGARGQTYKIAPEDTRDDIHTVALRSLARVPVFTKKPAHEQETIIAGLLDAGKGSFLWTILFTEALRTETTNESFDKALAVAGKTSVTDLVSKLLTTLQPTTESRLLLSWLTVSTRPMTIDEIACLISVKPETGEVTNTPPTVNSIIESVKPLLSIKRDVVRPRHGQVATTLQTVLQPLIEQGKIPVSHKNSQVDFLLRTLSYANSVLPKDGMPTLDNSDFTLSSKLFSRFPLLEYTIRYWTTHFEQTPFAPSGTAAPKVPAELKKAFPGSPVMPVLEWICWDDQYPGSQEVDLHTLVGRLRTEIFTQNHPAVMQSYINTAAYYVPMGNDREATKSYFYATTIGQTVLSPNNPVTIECGNRFLTLSSQMTSTTRTEIMTQRERVLQVLITAYEKQFGSTSELVINTRQQLMDLYTHINEKEKIENLRGQQDRSRQTGGEFDGYGGVDGGVKDSLGGKLRKRSDKKISSYDRIFGGAEDEEETSRSLDLTAAGELLDQARSFDSQKKYEESEEIYVDLWNQISTICRGTLSTEWHERKLEAVNSYAKSLEKQERKTEASGALVLLAEEYRHHELSFSEKIISKLTESAHTLRAFGHSSAALSIYRQAESYQKHFKKDQSSTTTSMFEEWIEQATSEVLQSSNNSASSSMSQSSKELLFKEQLMNSSKTVTASTVSQVQQESRKYIENHQYEEAVELIQMTLLRTWSSFFSESLHSITLSSTFLQENLILIEQLAQAYLAQRKIEKAIDVYLRLFRAALSSPKEHKDLLEKTKVQLVSIYDKYGYPDRAIGILQDVLAVYTRINGPTHELTISTLYELGSRTRQNARTHPYWIEYYQQLVTALTKESKSVDAKSFEAASILANQYWAERRYIDATSTFSLLWNTFTNKTKSVQQFSDATFAQTLYDRYRQSLEATQADQETIIRTTDEFQKTTKSQFGASAAISKSALSAYNQVCEQSTTSNSESRQLSIIQELLQQSSNNSSESRSLKQQKTNIFRRRLVEQKDVSSETLSEARSLFTEQLNEHRSSYGYADETTLNSLREVTMLDFRQKKTEEAMKSINIAVSEITTSEVSQEQAMQSAQSIAQIFQASQQTQRAQELIEDLRSQVIAKEKRTGSRSTFDVTQKSGNSALVFLASLEYHLRSDLSLTWSEIFAELLAERMYYQTFKKVTAGRSGLDKIVIAAAPLRHFLVKRNRKDQAQSLEQQIVALFVQRDLSSFSLEAKNTSPTIFITGILDFLGAKKRPDFVRAVIVATNRNLNKLIAANKFAEAYDIANVGFKYAQVQKGYEKPGAISMGFELASQLDGRGENKCPDETLRKKLLQLSNKIVKEILTICQDQQINLAQVQLTELNELIALLGEQADYETLEWLLTSLWNTREAQRTWPAEALLNLGQRLVCARYLAGHPVKAIRLCEDISYNLRRAHGISHPATLEAFQILAQLYTSTGQFYQKNAASDKSAAMLSADYFKKAILIEEDILRWFVAEGSGTQDDEDDTAAAILAEHGVKVSGPEDAEDSEENSVDRSAEVKTHLQLLKLAFQRYGQWPKPYGVYEQLNADVFAQYGESLKGQEGVEKWTSKGFGAGKAESNEGAFTAPAQWDILLH